MSMGWDNGEEAAELFWEEPNMIYDNERRGSIEILEHGVGFEICDFEFKNEDGNCWVRFKPLLEVYYIVRTYNILDKPKYLITLLSGKKYLI